MTIDEVYKYFDCNWCEMSRKTGLGYTTYMGWKRKGYIPMATQLRLEKLTNGGLKAHVLEL